MGIRSYIKNTVKTNTNFKTWLGWDAIKDSGRAIGSFAKNMSTQKYENESPVAVTFDEAVKKYGLTEKDIQKQVRTHWLLSIVCVVLGIIAVGWCFHLLFKGMLLSSLASLSLGAMMFAYAFQENFRYYQMKHRRLNCTVHEWFSNLFSFKR